MSHLVDYRKDMSRDTRCSYCKWIPLAQIKSWRFAYGCPSVAKYLFHNYSAGGKIIMGLSLLDKRLDYSDKFVDIVYQCQMCGACDVACKIISDREPLEIMRELRAQCVEDGQILPAHLVTIEGLRKEDNMMGGLKADRGRWAEGLEVKDLTKESAEVAYHAGCRYSYDEELQPIARATLNLLNKAGVDVGIMGKDETCCGGRAHEMGFQGEFTKYAESNIEAWTTAGVKTVITSCSDGFGAFKELYPRVDKEIRFEFLHITEFLAQLITEGRIKLNKRVPMLVTYHDPCHLSRFTEPFIPMPGKEHRAFGQAFVHEAPKVPRSKGVCEAPRYILDSIPGLKLVEMERIKESTWCCGAGGGVWEAYPDFALWTANERLEEAKATGAEALVTSCPWCERSFKDALAANGDKSFKVYDIVELIEQAI